MNNEELDNQELENEELNDIDEESEVEVPSSDYSDYEDNYDEPDDSYENAYSTVNQRQIQNQARELRNYAKNRNNQGAADKLKNRNLNTLSKNKEKENEDIKDKLEKDKQKVVQDQAKNKLAKDQAKQQGKEVVKKEVEKKAAKKAAEGAATKSGLAALVANPYFWIVVAIIIAIIILVILVVVLWAAYDGSNTEDDSNNSGSVVCSFNVNGTEMSDIKVKLLKCNGSGYIDGEDMVDFDKYILGVVYAENEGGPAEALKAQAIAAKSYVLNRPSVMGGNIKIEEENGQYVLSIRNCTNDQVYCDPDEGCWSSHKTAGDDVHSGYQSGKAFSKAPLAQDSEIRTAVAEVSDKILVDSNGNPFGASFNATTQKGWNSSASNGKDFSSILSDTYPNATISSATCTSTGSGNCNTSTPLKLASGESFVITSRFGKRTAPTAGASTYHKGIDLSAVTGTPIYSVFDGTVTHSGSYGTGGNTVIVSHDLDGDGKTDYKTEYMHMSKIDVKLNEQVSGGQKIGEVGSTGASTGPHLHFGIQNANSEHIDPESTLNSLISKTSMFDTASVCKTKSSEPNTSNVVKKGTFPYYNQCTGSWSSHIICDSADYVGGRCVSSNTICSSGCGYTSFSMIASGFNSDANIKPDNTVDFVAQYSSNSGGGAVSDDALINQAVLDHYNLGAEVLFPRLSSESIDSKKSKIVSALKKGRAVELLVPGHFVALVGIDSNDKITLNDPGKIENVGTYTIDELLTLFKIQRAGKCPGCSDSNYFQYAIAYWKK